MLATVNQSVNNWLIAIVSDDPSEFYQTRGWLSLLRLIKGYIGGRVQKRRHMAPGLRPGSPQPRVSRWLQPVTRLAIMARNRVYTGMLVE